MDRFELDPRTKPTSCRAASGRRSASSSGSRAAAPLTLLDEVHLGMDAPSRYAFYDALLADWLEHPRTIVLSSHLIGEVERLLEDVVVLDRGTVLTVVGRGDAALERRDGHRAGRRRRRRSSPAARSSRASSSAAPPRRRSSERAADDASARPAGGLELGPVALQDLFVHLTDRPVPAAPEESR